MQRRLSIAIGAVAFAMLLCGPPSASAQISLGSAQNFAVLGASLVTSTGTTLVTGNLGVSPGSGVTGFPPGIVTGTIHVADAIALQARADATAAYNAFAGAGCTVNLTGQDLGGLTLFPGVHCYATSAQLTGGLTLDALNNPSAVFIFQIGTTLTTAAGSSVTLINGASGCNVYWQVGTSATLGASNAFVGNVLASASITLAAGTNVSGRVLALNGAVTMDSDNVTIPPECQCAVPAAVLDLGPGYVAPSAPVLMSTPPVIGQTAVWTITSVVPSALVFIFLSDCGAPPFVVSGTACTVYVDLASLQLFYTDTTDSTGNWTLSFVVPPDQLLVSRCFVIQGLVRSGTGPLGGDLPTNGLRVTVGCL